MSITSWMLRLAFGRSDDKRDRSLTTPEEVERFDDIPYGEDERWQALDVYRPRGVEGKLPVIVSVHGGGWVYGDKERYQYYCMDLCRRGFAVVNFTYRLAPAHRFPASLEDTCRVFGWVLGHGEAYGFDLSNVFAVGDSAGGHLLSLFCCLCTNPEYRREFSFAVPEGFVPRAVALNCGAYVIDLAKGGLTSRLMKDVMKDYPGDERKINVLPHVTEGFPPAFVMTCSGDFLEEEASRMMDRLKEVGIPATYRYYGDKDNVLGHVFHLNIRSSVAALCTDEECAFFREHMG